jgi:hypothetical protein
MARYRGTSTQRGLGADHQADKKRLLALHRDGDPCWRCGQPTYKWQELDRDHVVDRALGGTDGPAVLAHAGCNRSAGARLSNQVRPQRTTAGPVDGRDTICTTCGKRYWYAARACEICGGHYHPHYSEQRSCSRACGVELRRRKYNGRQSSKPPKPKPLCAECGKPCNAGIKFCSRACATAARPPAPYAPRSSVTYYTCRYCGELGIAHGTGRKRRAVCPARACQLARIAANNLRLRSGMTQEDADAQMAAIMRGATPPQRKAVRSPTDSLGWTTVKPHRARDSRRTALHTCPGCGERTARPRWCDGCLCSSVNTKGRRCGNAASTDGKCDYHAEQAGQLAASRQW